MNKENNKCNDIEELMDDYLELIDKVDESIKKLDLDAPNKEVTTEDKKVFCVDFDSGELTEDEIRQRIIATINGKV